VRLCRQRLVAALGSRLSSLSSECDAALEAGDASKPEALLVAMQEEAADNVRDCYPELEKVPFAELTSWGDRAWDWERSAFSSPN